MALTGASARRVLPRLPGRVVLVAPGSVAGGPALAGPGAPAGHRHRERHPHLPHGHRGRGPWRSRRCWGVEGLLAHVSSGGSHRRGRAPRGGPVTVRPSDEVVSSGLRRGQRHEALTQHLLHDIHRQTALASGEPISLLANIEFSHEASFAVAHGAEGVGLYRTEFLYTDRTTLPTEDEQFEHFRAVLRAIEGRPLVFRTFDMGGRQAHREPDAAPPGEPRPRPPRHTPRPRAPGDPPHPAPRDAPRLRRGRRAHHGADGHLAPRVARGPGPLRPGPRRGSTSAASPGPRTSPSAS
jgi:hypothetical protein